VLGPGRFPRRFLVRSERAELLVTFAAASATEGFFAEMGIQVARQPHPGLVRIDRDDFARGTDGRDRDRRPAAHALVTATGLATAIR
jgi:hypothetical protein